MTITVTSIMDATEGCQILQNKYRWESILSYTHRLECALQVIHNRWSPKPSKCKYTQTQTHTHCNDLNWFWKESFHQSLSENKIKRLK